MEDYSQGKTYFLTFFFNSKTSLKDYEVNQDYASPLDYSQGNSFAVDWSTRGPKFW